MAQNGTSIGDSVATVPLLINGKDYMTDLTFLVNSPATERTVHHASSASVKDALAAVDAAAKAFPSWSQTKPAYRRTIFLKAADIMEARRQEFMDAMMGETGALEMFSAFNVDTALESMRDIAGRISAATSGTVPVCQQEGTMAMVLKEPFGVVLGIAPWNAPIILGLRSFAYALAVGNTAILKGSELSPNCFHLLGQCFTSAGLSEGCLNIIFHRPQDAAQVTTALIEHPAIKKVNFTGSTAVGSIIAGQCGKALKPCLMELGGKASAIVCDDADIGKAAKECALGAFLHSGQICMSTERILVHKAIIEPFSQALKEAVAQIFSSEQPAPVLVASATVQKNKKLITDAKSKGASILAGDPDVQESSEFRMRPIIVEGVTKDMDLYHTESFGPSVSLIAVASDEEAVEIANDTEYGLSGAVFTDNLARGLKLARSIESGAIHINSMSVHDEANLPHGGTKKSGWGRFNAAWGMDEFLRTKTITWQE